MEHVQLTVRGADAWTVPRALKDVPEKKRFDYDGDGFAVIVTEQFFLRINSTLQVTTIFELVDDDVCKVTLVPGGGAAGLLQRDVGSESTARNDLLRKIEDYCRANDLELER